MYKSLMKYYILHEYVLEVQLCKNLQKVHAEFCTIYEKVYET